jgi:hypothetical protein
VADIRRTADADLSLDETRAAMVIQFGTISFADESSMNNNQDRVVESDKVLELAALGSHYEMAAIPVPHAAFNDGLGLDAREIRRALRSSIAWLVDNQSEEGFWAGRVESNSCIEAE